VIKAKLLALLGVLAVLCLLSIAVGARQIPPGDVITALFSDHLPDIEGIVWGARVPRTALGLLVGAALGLAGAVMQALTRNPLADPGLLGISSGAAFGVVIAVALAGVTSLYGYIWFAFAGALITSVVVYAIGGRSTTPVRLALAGVAVSALLTSLTSGISFVDPDALNRYRYWAAGSLAGQNLALVWQVVPFVLAGAVLALASAPAMNSLSLGEDVATSLGRNLALVRLRGVVAITLLTGAAVAAIGPVVFVGLVVPHIARLITGSDHRWLLPFAAVLAPILLLGADILGRIIGRPGEVGVGIMVAFLGAPFFIMLVRRRRLAEV
jgi:iron complex transport system permease protein